MLNDYDIKVLIALNKIQNDNSVKTEELTSWIVTKKLTKKARDLENSYVLTSLKRMNKLGLVNLEIEKFPNKIRKIWTIDYSKVCFKKIKILGKIRNCVICSINEKLFIREL